jgi:ribose-phosphate pyrophosphokinase
MNLDSLTKIPYGQLGIIALESCKDLGHKIDHYLLEKRKDIDNDLSTYLISVDEIRLSNGEGKIILEETVRGKDIYILCDIGNYGCTYEMFGFTNHKGPDDHFQDIKRVLSALGGKARRITVIMPLLVASRQHKRKRRESLDCAIALQELERLGVQDILTFDAHDPTVQNAIPMISFDNLYPTYEIVKSLIREEEDFLTCRSNMLVISPDTGAMDRAIYYAGVLGLDIGLFYKRRDYSTIVKGKNPIIQHEYLGRSIEGQNILIVDDMIASGESIFDIAKELKKRNAKKIYVAVTFSLFTEGIEKFNEFYERGLIDKVYSTNLSYLPNKVKEAPWFQEVDMSKFISKLIDNINYDKSISNLIDATEGIKLLMNQSNK